jgi:flagellar hook protein FlgE
MNISSNVSSLQSNQTFMNSNAVNIANASKRGNDVDLSKEMTDQVVGEKVNAVNVSAIKTQDEMLGSLLDIKA